MIKCYYFSSYFLYLILPLTTLVILSLTLVTAVLTDSMVDADGFEGTLVLVEYFWIDLCSFDTVGKVLEALVVLVDLVVEVVPVGLPLASFFDEVVVVDDEYSFGPVPESVKVCFV